MKTVTLLRHGLTEANARWLYCGATDIPLSPAGREALRALRAGALYPPAAGALIVTSGMRRAEETLSILYGPAAHAVEPGLREMDFGAFEMRSWTELKDEPDYRAWREGDEKSRCPGGESGEEMTERVLAALDGLLAADRDLLIVTHGGPIAAIMDRWFPAERKSRWDWQPAGGEGYRVALDGRSPPVWEAVPK